MARYSKSKKKKIEQAKILAQLLGPQQSGMKDEGLRKAVFTKANNERQVIEDLPKNPNANMAYALGRCFQCGTVFSDEDKKLNDIVHRPNAIVFCNDCFKFFTAYSNGTVSADTPLDIPFAFKDECEEEYTKLVKSQN
jgi:hypothetical protein